MRSAPIPASLALLQQVVRWDCLSTDQDGVRTTFPPEIMSLLLVEEERVVSVLCDVL